MAEYVGLKAIGKRLGYRGAASVIRLLRQEGLPIYRSRRPAKGPGHHWQLCWVIDDDLIRRWQLLRARTALDDLDAAGKYGDRRPNHAKGTAWVPASDSPRRRREITPTRAAAPELEGDNSDK